MVNASCGGSQWSFYLWRCREPFPLEAMLGAQPGTDLQLEPRSLVVPELCLSLQLLLFVCSSTKGHCWGDEVGISLDWRAFAVQFGTG